MTENAQVVPASPIDHAVLAEIGEPRLFLPSLVNRGLEANARAKYFLSLLQAARAHAEEATAGTPVSPGLSSLREERIASGVIDARFDAVVEASSQEGPNRFVIPGAGRIHRQLVDAIAEMVSPLDLADGLVQGGSRFRTRLHALTTDAPDLSTDWVEGTYVDRITSARPESGDSLHLLVMDAHRALNALQAQIASDSVDGAAVYGLGSGDAELVEAFMRGIHRTEALKFDHPGLATTATRAGGRLLIQNDLGTTSSHVVVIAVDDLTATLTHTDVHQRRLHFFQSCFAGFDVRWSDAQHHRETPLVGEHHLTVGTYPAPDRTTLEAFLEHAGSRLVFVLDWNRARKRLGLFMSNQDAIEVLHWAAAHDVGHMAFLALGAERLIYEAVELSAKVPARYGEPLIDVLGRDATVAITKFALGSAAQGLLAGKSALLIRDELRVEVLRHVQAAHGRLLDDSAEHASLVVECAQSLHTALLRLATAEGTEYLARAVGRAARWEHRADEILMTQRQAARRVEDSQGVSALTATADDAIDCLEESVFLLTLLDRESRTVVLPILEPLAAIAVMTAQEHLKAVEFARLVVAGSAPEDLEEFLIAVDRVATLEHDADRVDRTARAALVTQAPEFRSLYVADSVCRGIEDATDSLLRSVLGLRDHILAAVAS